jgi:hypothetical protein
MSKKEKVKVEVVFHKHTYKDGDVILLDENNTFYNIRLLIQKQYPDIPIEIINEGRGER